MSSNKSASQLVTLLDDLYGKFDDLCDTCGCEKIATLGDCYYCVSGCPNPRADHADCCLEMGLCMIDAIASFDIEHGEDVQMRVGVHTGSVNCGIIGVHKFKFDIFSNDVTLANKMESSGRPGYVHITESTLHALDKNIYNVEDTDPFNFLGCVHNTYLINRGDHPVNSEDTVLNCEAIISNRDAEDSTVSKPARLFDIVEQQSLLSFEGHLRKKRNESMSKKLFPALSPWTLSFTNKSIEKDYKNFCTDDDHSHNLSNPEGRLIASTIISTLYCTFFLIVLISQLEIHHRAVTLTCVCIVGLFYMNIFVLIYVTIFANPLVYKRTIQIQASYVSYLFLSCPLIIWSSYLRYNKDKPLCQFIVLSSFMHLCLFPFAVSNIKIIIGMLTLVLVNLYCIHFDIFCHFAIVFLYILAVAAIREKERIARILFFAEHECKMENVKSHDDKECAEWLLRNVLPSFTIESLLLGEKYAQNYENVGVAFITLTNYLTDLYEEQFEGGQFYGRVLNELFADVDNLLTSSEYNGTIEKIKTIGPTYMVASGLGQFLLPQPEQNNQHLIALIKFVKSFIKSANRFSASMFNFEFIVRAGYNFGPITAGVLGRSRLSFDIWGDTVNVASRMDSKGINGRIQVPEHAAEFLKENNYQVENRGSIYIKGKDMMNVFLLVDEEIAEN